MLLVIGLFSYSRIACLACGLSPDAEEAAYMWHIGEDSMGKTREKADQLQRVIVNGKQISYIFTVAKFDGLYSFYFAFNH